MPKRKDKQKPCWEHSPAFNDLTARVPSASSTPAPAETAAETPLPATSTTPVTEVDQLRGSQNTGSKLSAYTASPEDLAAREGTPTGDQGDRPSAATHDGMPFPGVAGSANITTIPEELKMIDVESYIKIACDLAQNDLTPTRLFDSGMIHFAEGDYTPFTFNAEQPLAKQYLDWIRANKEHAIRLLNNKDPGSIYDQIFQKLPALAKTILAEERSALADTLRVKYPDPGTDDAIATAITEAFSTAWDEKIKDKMANTIVSHIIMHVANQKRDTEGDTEFRPHFPMGIPSILAQRCRQPMEIRTDHETYAKEVLESSMLLQDHTFKITNLLSLDEFCAQKIKNPAFYGESGLSERQNLDDFLNYLLDQHPEHSWWGESDRINTLHDYLQYCRGNATGTTDIDGVIAQVLYKAPVGHPARDVLLSKMHTPIAAAPLPPQYAPLLKAKKLKDTYLGMLAAFYKAQGREPSAADEDFSAYANTIAKQCIALHDALPFLASFEFPNPITAATLNNPEFEANISILYYHMLRYHRAGFLGVDESISVIAAFFSHCDPAIFNLVKENMAKVFSYLDQNEAAKPQFKFFPRLIMGRSYNPDHITCSNEQDIQELNAISQMAATLINTALQSPHPRATAASAAQNAAPVPTEFQTRMEQSKSLVKSYRTSEPTRAKVRARILPPKTPSTVTNFGYGVTGAFIGIGVLATAAALAVAAPVVLVAVAAVAITSFVAAAATWFITRMRDPTNKPAKSRLTPEDEELIKDLKDMPAALPSFFSKIETLRQKLIDLNGSIQSNNLSDTCQNMFAAAYQGNTLTTAPADSLTEGYTDRLIRLKSEGDPSSKVTQLRALENDAKSQCKVLERACYMSQLCLDLPKVLETLISTDYDVSPPPEKLFEPISNQLTALTLGEVDRAMPALISFLSRYSRSDLETAAKSIDKIIAHAGETSHFASTATLFFSALKSSLQDNPSTAAIVSNVSPPVPSAASLNGVMMSTVTSFGSEIPDQTYTPDFAGVGLFF